MSGKGGRVGFFSFKAGLAGLGEGLDGLKRVGVVFADSGYVSQQIKQDLMAKDIAFVAKPTTAMEDMRWHFDKNWAKQYRQRQVVEGVFSRLKNRFGLLAHSCRCATSLTVRMLASIVAYNLLQPAS